MIEADETGNSNLTSGDCLRIALSGAGYEDIEVKPWPNFEEYKAICETLGLTLHSRESDTRPPSDAQVIAIYHTSRGKGHAELTNNLDDIYKRGETVIAVIEIPKHK